MKKVLTISLVSIFSISYVQLFSQEPCKVIKSEIAVKYEGKCKKGLAHGRGIAEGKDKYEGNFKEGLPHGSGLYKYANGDVYYGDFSKGMRHGTGKFTFKYNNRDSSYLGIWKEDVLVKKILPPKYVVLRSMSISRYSVQKINEGKRVLFTFMQNGMYNATISNLLFAPNGGTLVTIGNQQGFENITFPFTCKVTFLTENQLKTASYEVAFEIQINEPGEWVITLNN